MTNNSEMDSKLSERSIARALTLLAALLLAVLGLAPKAWEHEWAWVARFALFGALGLWMANSRFEILRQLGVTLVLLFIANQALSPLLMAHLQDKEFVTLGANIDRHIRLLGDVMPGIEGVQHVTTDAKGFRTTLPVDYRQKPAGTLRVFAVGGSTTEQIYLDDRKTWTHLLQEEMAAAGKTRVEVVNTGVSGLRTPHHLATLNHIAPYQPDLVVILMGVNDWIHQILEATDESRRGPGRWWRNMSYPNTALVFLSRQVRSAMRRADSQAASGPAKAKVEDFDGSYYSKQNDSLSRPQRTFPGEIRVSPDYVAATQQLIAACKTLKMRCVFVTQPTAYDPGIDPALKRRLWMTPPGVNYTLPLAEMAQFARAYNRSLVDTVRSHGGEVCDVVPALPPTTGYFYDDCHFNENGARVMARAVQACIAAAPKAAN
ncbi:MAG: GDSL-type esterase/lipase family protein [Proteobacteria bacterium]|nr:GDSL-type esterase/lipase family protein [Pseudomonadota bacterium]